MSSGPAPAAADAAWPADARTKPIRARLAVTMLVFGSLAVVTCLLAPLVGTTSIDLARAFDRSIPFDRNVDAQIFFVARLPRVLAAAVVGATLAAAGVVFQALLRNPLATPFTLGISAGASLGAMLALVSGLQPPLRNHHVSGHVTTAPQRRGAVLAADRKAARRQQAGQMVVQ